MKLIVGLGNVGDLYNNTRHNVGFMVIDEIAKKLDIKVNQRKYNSFFYKNDDFILIKPTTFMNLSGVAVKAVVEAFNISISNIIVVCDDLDTSVGQAKIKISKSSGGHNGIKDIIEKLDNAKFYRLKIGIGRPKGKEDVSKYVLSSFNKKEEPIIKTVISKAADAVMSIVYNDVNYVINYFNRKDE